jgi:hypothetical protein
MDGGSGVIDRPTSDTGDLHLNCETLYYEGSKAGMDEQAFGFENGTAIGKLITSTVTSRCSKAARQMVIISVMP